MGPLIYSLCQKSVLSAAMSAVALCEFPPLFKGQQLDLAMPGTSMTTEINVPVELAYALQLEASTPDGEPLSKEEVRILGNKRSVSCNETESKADGRPMPFKIEVVRLDDSVMVFERQVSNVCVSSLWSNVRYRTLATLPLAQGKYRVRVENIASQPGLGRLKLMLQMVPPSP